MSQGQVAVNHEPREQTTKPTISDTTQKTVRYWEWDCSVRPQIISIFRQNSSQFDTFRQSWCNSYTQSQPFVYWNQSRQCPILGDNPTEFIIIQHNPTHFERPR